VRAPGFAELWGAGYVDGLGSEGLVEGFEHDGALDLPVRCVRTRKIEEEVWGTYSSISGE